MKKSAAFAKVLLLLALVASSSALWAADKLIPYHDPHTSADTFKKNRVSQKYALTQLDGSAVQYAPATMPQTELNFVVEVPHNFPRAYRIVTAYADFAADDIIKEGVCLPLTVQDDGSGLYQGRLRLDTHCRPSPLLASARPRGYVYLRLLDDQGHQLRIEGLFVFQKNSLDRSPLGFNQSQAYFKFPNLDFDIYKFG